MDVVRATFSPMEGHFYFSFWSHYCVLVALSWFGVCLEFLCGLSVFPLQLAMGGSCSELHPVLEPSLFTLLARRACEPSGDQ